MADIFSNLAAQSLNSRVGIVPLISPLFAPAPQILSDAALLPSNDKPAVLAEHAPFSISSTISPDGITDTSDIKQPPEEATSPEKRAVLPDLVPPNVRQHAVTTLSLRHLLRPQRIVNENKESVSPTSQTSILASTIDDHLSEDTGSLDSLPDNSVGPSVELAERVSIPLRPSPMYRPLFEQPQETTPSNAIPNIPEIPSSSIRHDNQKLLDDQPDQQPLSLMQSRMQPATTLDRRDRFIESTIAVLAPKPTQQPTTDNKPDQEPDIPTQLQHRAGQAPIQPLLGQTARPVRRGEGGEERSNRPLWQEVRGTSSSAVSPGASGITQPPVPPITMPAQDVSPAIMMPTSHETRDVATTAVSAPRRSTAADAQDAAPGSPKRDAHIAKEEPSPIRITIGRVVVRTTPAAPPPTPTQKRVLHPAQTLGEYLKQRERGSR